MELWTERDQEGVRHMMAEITGNPSWPSKPVQLSLPLAEPAAYDLDNDFDSLGFVEDD